MLRTDFTDPAGWARLLQVLKTPVAFDEDTRDIRDYDRAITYVIPIDDEKYQGLLPETVLAAAPETGHDLPYDHLYLADAATFASDELPLLGIDIHEDAGYERWPREEPFRVPALHLATVEINDSLGNLSFREFYGSDWADFEVYPAEPGTAVWEEFRQLDQ